MAASANVAGSPTPGRVVVCLPCDASDKGSVRELFGVDLSLLLMVPLPDRKEAVTLSLIEEREGYNSDDDDGARRSVWPSSCSPLILAHKNTIPPVCVPSPSSWRSSHTQTS